MASLTLTRECSECEEYQGPVHYPNQRWIPLAWHRQNEPKDIVTWILYLYFHLCEYWTAFAFVFVFAFALVKPVYPQGEALHCELHSNCLCSKFEKVLRSKLFQLKHDIKTLQVLHSPDKWRMAKMWFWLTAKNIKSRPWLHPGTLRENSSLPESRQKALNWN